MLYSLDDEGMYSLPDYCGSYIPYDGNYKTPVLLQLYTIEEKICSKSIWKEMKEVRAILYRKDRWKKIKKLLWQADRIVKGSKLILSLIKVYVRLQNILKLRLLIFN